MDTESMTRPKWPARRFLFHHPEWMLHDFTERLRGTAARLEELLDSAPRDILTARVDGTWSILQNAGHLADVEELWEQRLEDLRAGRAVLTPADPKRFAHLAERHQSRTATDVLTEFRERRAAFTRALIEASPELQARSAFHERLNGPMRLVDCAQFAAEHDDHHLLRIRDLIAILSPQHKTTRPPIACELGALNPDERQRRAILAERLIAATREVRETPGGYRLRLSGTPEATLEAAELAGLEHRCCPFLEIGLKFDGDGGPVWLILEGGAEAKGFLRGMGLVAGA